MDYTLAHDANQNLFPTGGDVSNNNSLNENKNLDHSNTASDPEPSPLAQNQSNNEESESQSVLIKKIERPHTSQTEDIRIIRHSSCHTIEIFFGKVESLNTFYKCLCDNANSETEDLELVGINKMNPESVRKLVLVGHPLKSFSGLNKFIMLSEAWITHCKILNLKWSDFDGLKNLQKLYIYNCGIESVEPLKFNNLKILWIADNKIETLNFLSHGIPSLQELNAGANFISSINESDLFKCINLTNLNISGNPLCSLQDISGLKALASLENLYLSDPLYGRCPIASSCDSRPILISVLNHIASLDGKPITSPEIAYSLEYVSSRAVHYFANSVRFGATQSVFRKTALLSTSKKLEGIGKRIEIIQNLLSSFRKLFMNAGPVPNFTNAKILMREQIENLETRKKYLHSLAKASIARIETLMHLSKWEQEIEVWIKWIEYKSFGNTHCHIIHSVHGPLVGDSVHLCENFHQIISSLSCPGLWPANTIMKVETIVVIQDKGMELGIQKTYEYSYGDQDEPPFIPPVELMTPSPPLNSFHPQPPVYVQTYTDPNYRPPQARFNFPDSIPGIVEKAETVYLYLECPPGVTNPFVYLSRMFEQKYDFYKEIVLTNCLWSAIQNRNNEMAVIIIVKVLSESVQLVGPCKKPTTSVLCKHSGDCSNFILKMPLSIAPAYIISLSFTPDGKSEIWSRESIPNEDDIFVPAKAALNAINDKLVKHGQGNLRSRWMGKKANFIRKVGEDLMADLSAMQIFINKNGELECGDVNEKESNIFPVSCYSQSMLNFIGAEVGPALTSLDLSGNKLPLLVGLEGLNNLRKINLSHNLLENINSLQKLPQLIELKLGWNLLKNLESIGKILEVATPRLLTLELLPNSFQDIRQFGHIPLIIKRYLPTLNRIDIWSAPFGKNKDSSLYPPVPQIAQKGIDEIAMSGSWVGSFTICKDLSGKCLTNLETMPMSLPFADGFITDGVDLNLSDNYLISDALTISPFVKTKEWGTALIKLQLQDNNIENLDWMEEAKFPNLEILNLSNNYISDLEPIRDVCNSLRHLELCNNPLPADSKTLTPLEPMKNLITLDCTGSPLTNFVAYSTFVKEKLSSVKVLDGISIFKWETVSSINQSGGILTPDWLEQKLSNSRDWSTLTRLAIPHSNLQKISLPAQCLPKLMSLDLNDNNLTSFFSLTSLPSLRVLSMSYNKVATLGQTCPTCFSSTVQSQMSLKQKSAATLGLPTDSPFSQSLMPKKPKPIFPKLELLILSHNDITSLNDLHLHSIPHLQTVFLNCNKLSNLQGIERISSVQALVLDFNRIKNVPMNSFSGCKSLRYLHLEHNRLTTLPRLSNLNTLKGLHIGYNKIQSLTDINCIPHVVKEMTLIGNPGTDRKDYRFKIALNHPYLLKLDGRTLKPEIRKIHDVRTELTSEKKIQNEKIDEDEGNKQLRPSTAKTPVKVVGTTLRKKNFMRLARKSEYERLNSTKNKQ